jgi:hypothetical protein
VESRKMSELFGYLVCVVKGAFGEVSLTWMDKIMWLTMSSTAGSVRNLSIFDSMKMYFWLNFAC